MYFAGEKKLKKGCVVTLIYGNMDQLDVLYIVKYLLNIDR